MPSFDLRNILVGKYSGESGIVTYSNVQKLGDAMSVDLALTFAESSLYAEGTLAEYIKAATGGTASIGVKYIPATVQQLLFGSHTRTRTVHGKQISSNTMTANDVGSYVGFGFYAPSKVDGVTKYDAAFIYKALFGAPSTSLKTKGDSIAFATPTTSGNFLPDDTYSQNIIDSCTCDSAEDAVAWVQSCFGMQECSSPMATPAAGAVVSGTSIALTSATQDAKIYYTLDGSDPTSGGMLYVPANKLTIKEPCTLRAIAVKTGNANSSSIEETYTIKP